MIPEGYGFLLHVQSSGDEYYKILVYYHPSITGTLLSPTSIINSSHEPNGNFTGQSIHRWFDNYTMLTGNVTLVLHHQCSKAQNIVVHGCLFGGQLYTHPLIIPDQHPNNPNATMHNLFQLAQAHKINCSLIHVNRQLI